MRMTVIEHWPEDVAFDGTPIPPRVQPPTTFEGGWQSVKEMQRELIRRFPHDGPKRITKRRHVHDAELRADLCLSRCTSEANRYYNRKETREFEETMKMALDEILNALTPEKRIPDTLQRELRVMRRNPDGYSVVRMVKCGLGCGKLKAYSLTHADSENTGTWCPTHGWLFFDSVALPPTERLSDSELEDRRLEQRRKAGFAQRKQQSDREEKRQ